MTKARFPSAIRAATVSALKCPSAASILEIGKGRIVKEGTKIALLSFGTRLAECLLAAETSGKCRAFDHALPMPALPSRWMRQLIARLARDHEVLITVEEGAIGGFGSHVLSFLAREGLLDNGLQRSPAFPAGRIHRSGQARSDVSQCAGWTAEGIVAHGL